LPHSLAAQPLEQDLRPGNGLDRRADARTPTGDPFIGRLTLDNALKLLFLYAEKEPIKFERAALRWLGRYVTEGKATSLLKAQLALAALSELRAGERESAAKLLVELVRR
jgi:hypothetical protein